MALDPSDVQTDEDYDEELVSRSFASVGFSGGKVQKSTIKWVNWVASRCSGRLMHSGSESQDNGV